MKKNKKLDITKQKPSMLIIRLAVGDELHNFILDTGSNSCTIDYNIIDSNNKLNHYYYEKADDADSACGDISIFGSVEIPLMIDDKQVYWPFSISNIHKAFEAIEKDHGITISGIIGCDFMRYYKTIIDFKKDQIIFHV